MGREELHLFRQTMRTRRSASKPYSRLSAIRSSILATFANGGLIQQAGGPVAGHDFLERGKYPG